MNNQNQPLSKKASKKQMSARVINDITNIMFNEYAGSMATLDQFSRAWRQELNYNSIVERNLLSDCYMTMMKYHITSGNRGVIYMVADYLAEFTVKKYPNITPEQRKRESTAIAKHLMRRLTHPKQPKIVVAKQHREQNAYLQSEIRWMFKQFTH